MLYILKKVKLISDDEIRQLEDITREYINLSEQYADSGIEDKTVIIKKLSLLRNKRERLIDAKREVWEAVKIQE